jgi:predicted Rossmann fold flavoprotein
MAIKNKKGLRKIAIIGGGAAGMMAAATILEGGTGNFEIHLFEKNKRLGVKVAISGGGRCNVTTGITEKNLLMSKYIRGREFLKPSFAAFPPEKVRQWFEDHDVPLKEEEDKRVFPKSDVGTDIIAAFEQIYAGRNMHVHFMEGIKDIQKDVDGFSIKTANSDYKFDTVVLASGANAYAHTGSTGDGYNFAKNFGHSITPLGPSLNSFEVKEIWCKEISGLSFPNAKFKTTLSTGEKISVEGPMLFTHFGISGPAVFALAAHIAFEKIMPNTPLEISLMPEAGHDFNYWDQKLLQLFAEKGSRHIDNCLSELLPQRFTDKLLEVCEIEKDKKSAELTKLKRQSIARMLGDGLTITLLSRRPGDEFVTAGGIELSEVDRKTMRSKLNPNLYFAGEILNIDGLTGGFNLQAAWATGRVAGLNILKSIQ